MPGVVPALRDGQLRDLEALRCGGCRRMLLRIDRDALRAGKALEVKCGRCDYMNYLIGPRDTT